MNSGAARRSRTHHLAAAALAFALCCAGAASAQNRNLAEGFKGLKPDASVVLMPADIELFSISAGGIGEPKADWTDAASKNFRAALLEKKRSIGLNAIELADQDADEVAEINALHAAVVQAIDLHHFGPANLHLPTKGGKLDWSLGDAVRPIRDKTGADYALFSWIRDSYASGERVATIVVLAMVGVAAGGGRQVGYASLVDLRTGQVVWYNRLARASGDLREAPKAKETVEALLGNFPGIEK